MKYLSPRILFPIIYCFTLAACYEFRDENLNKKTINLNKLNEEEDYATKDFNEIQSDLITKLADLIHFYSQYVELTNMLYSPANGEAIREKTQEETYLEGLIVETTTSLNEIIASKTKGHLTDLQYRQKTTSLKQQIDQGRYSLGLNLRRVENKLALEINKKLTNIKKLYEWGQTYIYTYRFAYSLPSKREEEEIHLRKHAFVTALQELQSDLVRLDFSLDSLTLINEKIKRVREVLVFWIGAKPEVIVGNYLKKEEFLHSKQILGNDLYNQIQVGVKNLETKKDAFDKWQYKGEELMDEKKIQQETLTYLKDAEEVKLNVVFARILIEVDKHSKYEKTVSNHKFSLFSLIVSQVDSALKADISRRRNWINGVLNLISQPSMHAKFESLGEKIQALKSKSYGKALNKAASIFDEAYQIASSGQ